MYIQNEEGTYIESSETQFPTDGYVLNVEKSSCRNGGELSQNPNTKKISLTASKTDACTLYFDLLLPSFSIDDIKALSKGALTNLDELAPKPLEYQDNNFNGTQSNYDMTNKKLYYITYASSYTFDTSTGLYTLINPQTCRYSSCYTTLRGKYIVNTYGSSTNTKATSSNLITIYKVGTETTTTSMPTVISSATIISYDYSKDGIYEMEDDYGTSYYYRGAVENNYVKFGKNKSGQDMYWRIIRINGDGSLRIIYDGTKAHINGESSTDRVALTKVTFNNTSNDAKYVGYMYSPIGTTASTSKEQAQTNETDSTIKTQLDAWYKENIVDTGYSYAVSDEVFCNDRSILDGSKGYGGNTTYYAGNTRIRSKNQNLILKCPQQNDAFTVKDVIKGNGNLTYPIGLITADEVRLAGNRYDSSNANIKNYLYKGAYYPTMTAHMLNNTASSSIAVVYYLTDRGYITDYSVTNTSATVPVINLSAEYVNTFIGTGTMTDPYRSVKE